MKKSIYYEEGQIKVSEETRQVLAAGIVGMIFTLFLLGSLNQLNTIVLLISNVAFIFTGYKLKEKLEAR